MRLLQKCFFGIHPGNPYGTPPSKFCGTPSRTYSGIPLVTASGIPPRGASVVSTDSLKILSQNNTIIFLHTLIEILTEYRHKIPTEFSSKSHQSSSPIIFRNSTRFSTVLE